MYLMNLPQNPLHCAAITVSSITTTATTTTTGAITTALPLNTNGITAATR